MGDDEDDPEPSAKEVLFDADGNLRWRRALDALRGRGTSDTDLGPLLVVALIAVLVGAPVWGFIEEGTLIHALEITATWLIGYFVLLFFVTLGRVEDYFSGDEEVAIETLRSRYAEGELDLDEFQRQVDRVYREGPETVWADDDEPEAGSEDDGEGRDPVAILRERFARGEIDEGEFRRRMEVLGQPVEDETAREPIRERET